MSEHEKATPRPSRERPATILATISEPTRYVTERVYLAFAADDYISRLEVQIDASRARIEELGRDLQQYKRKLAVIFDDSTYSDSYGVEGSSFSVCRWCGGGSGPGGSAPFKHNAGCLMDDAVLEAKVAEVWDEDTAKECLASRALIEQMRDALDGLDMASRDGRAIPEWLGERIEGSVRPALAAAEKFLKEGQ